MDAIEGVEGCALVGMVHLLPLPGSPGWGGDVGALRRRARADAEALLSGGCDAVIVENMGDLPYLKEAVGPDTLAAMTLCVADVVALGAPVGVQVLAGANAQALAMAGVTGAAFIRAEAFAYGHLADEGWIEACAGPLLRQRATDGLPHVRIWADVQKKHAAHAVSADLTLEALARGHRFCGADVLVVTGGETGAHTSPADVAEAALSGLPVAVGSGVTPDDAAALAPVARALVVGSWLKRDGDWRNEVDRARVRALRSALDQA
jgi:membrane complex biogenesis BtpA family protein